MATSRRRNRHHLWWPRTAYTTPTERRFRSLSCGVIEMDIEMHRLFHAMSEPPTKPSHDEMVVAIERHKAKECGCY